MNGMHIGKAANAGHIEIDKQTNYIYETDVEKDSCPRDLYITNPQADKQRIEHEKGGLLKDCYSWILYNDNFLQWRDDPEQHLLWVRGDPGKGKTMLLAGLITELEKASDDGIFYFFCQAARPSHRTASNVLRGVIWFIVCKRPALKCYVRKEYDQASSSVFTDHNAWYALSGILTAILEDEISADFIIIIDALDECTEGREKLIGYISQLAVSCRAKWVISSRNWPQIESQLDATQSQVRLHLELNHASISNAVLKFVDRKVTQLNSTYNQSNRAQIRKHLLDNANDTFLWVALVCQELEKPGVKHYHSYSILQRFPAGLNDLYERMISDINDRDIRWCKAILAVIAVALRPLSLQELAAADGSLTQWIEDKVTMSSLVTSCGSLLTIRGDTVYTVHQSVNDFLRKTPKILPSGIAQQQLSIFLNSIQVMQAMLHRNLYELKDNCALIDEIAILPSAPLTIAGYACTYWVDHFCEWPLANDQHQINLYYTMITQFLESKYLYWLEAMSLLRCTSAAIKAMQRLEERLVSSDISRGWNWWFTIPQKSRAPDELKLLVKDALRFASAHRTIMDAAPLQIYDSALLFTPQLSKIKVCFHHEINKSMDVFSAGFQHWDACIQTIPGIAKGRAGWPICEFSPDGQQVAVINRNEDRVLLIDASTGGLVKSIEPTGGCMLGFTFHPSGDSLVTLSYDTKHKTQLSIFHLPNGERSKSFTVVQDYNAPFLSFCPDGQLVAIAPNHHTVDIWNTTSETKVNSFHRVSGSFVKYVAWIRTVLHPRAFLIIGRDDISIWDLDTRHQTTKLMSLTGIAYPDAATISHDRRFCAVSHEGKELVLYSWGSSITVQKIARFDQSMSVYDASWVADRSIALCGDFGIEVWDFESKRLVAQVRSDHVMTICYGRNRQFASTESRTGNLRIWSLDTILSHSEPTTQQSGSIARKFITSPGGKAAVISDNGELDMLSIAADGRFHHLPKTLQNSPPGSYYTRESLTFGHDDYFAAATKLGAVHVFNFDHNKGLYYCERRIGECLAPEDYPYMYLTIQFWGQDQIITYGNFINFWDLKTGEYLRKLSIPYPLTYCRSTITADGQIAWGKGDYEIVIWDIICGKETQCFDLQVLHSDIVVVPKVSLNSIGLLAILAWNCDRRFIGIGNAKDGSWIRKFSVPTSVPTLNFLSPMLLDTAFGILAYDMELGSSEDIPTLTAEDCWDPRYLRLSCSRYEAWLMKGSRRILWIPRQDVDLERFSIQTDLEAGKSTVTLVHDGCLFILTIEIDSI
ncbi:hypothetical protein FPRO03_03740 [Fusarium proliferatum]|nr:hypothetical protein FPRO03_03740 [Fusarium proliferatum]